MLIRDAIRQRRLIAFTLTGLPRRAEPHDYGTINGVARLFFYQVGGRSTSGPPVGWRWALLTDMRNIQVLDEEFDGPRDTGSSRHVHWDVLLASVSRPVAGKL